MRKINEIIFHCSATKEGQAFTVKDIDRWHKERGWKGIGYHFVIYLDGSVHPGRPVEEIGAHTLNHNSNSIGVCYIGGLDAHGKAKDTRTPAQLRAMEKLVKEFRVKYPNATFHGHNEFANKACPCFDVRSWVKTVK
ncbi:MAG: N-acetylmuramoyl-L-alanine amidase [Dysgonomonas sp.]